MNNNIINNEEFANENIYEKQCPIIYALDIVGQKWKLPIMWYLFENQIIRYNELKRSIGGITNMMLTKSLKELEGNKLITRTQYNEIPPRVEYSLTERGKGLIPALNELYIWGKQQMDFHKYEGDVNNEKRIKF